MDPLSITFGALQGVTTCVEIGNALVETYRSYTEANQELEELRIRITHQWYKIQPSLKFLRSVYPSLEPEHQEHLDSVVKTLQYKLETAVTNISRVNKKKGSFRKLKYAVLVKSQLLHDLKELEEWQTRLEPSMFLVTRTKASAVDQKIEECTNDISSADNSDKGIVRQLTVIRDLRRVAKASGGYSGVLQNLGLSPQDLVGGKEPIWYSSVKTTAIRRGREHIPVIVNTLTPGSRVDMREFEQDMYELVKILSKSEPMTFGMLRCRGFIPYNHSPQTPSYYGANSNPLQHIDLIFDFPGTLSRPKSLRMILNEATTATAQNRQNHPLGARIRLAKQLARSVMFVHTCGMVHKNIRPECVLVFQGADTPQPLHRSYSVPQQYQPQHERKYSYPQYSSNNYPYSNPSPNPSISSLSINSSTTLTPDHDHNSLGTPFLVGFERTRRSTTATLLSPLSSDPRSPSPSFDPQDELWHRGLYHHPRRQGIYPEERYSIEHDMYSLGVCLLEIGLWTTFVTRDHEGRGNVVGPILAAEGLGEIISGASGGFSPTATVFPPGATTPTLPKERAEAVKQALLRIAHTRLPQVVGEKYRDVVVTCLSGFGDDMRAAEGSSLDLRAPSPLPWGEREGDSGAGVGVMFIEMVIRRLEEIVV